MAEMIKEFKKFILRDLSYMAGGSLVFFCFLISNNMESKFLNYYEKENFLYLFLVVLIVCYFCGYAIQEASTIIGLSQTKVKKIENGDWRLIIYSKFLGTNIKEIENERKLVKNEKQAYIDAKNWLDNSNEMTKKEQFERIQTLKNYGTALGPSFLLSSFFITYSEFKIKILDFFAYKPFADACFEIHLFLSFIVLFIFYYLILRFLQNYPIHFPKLVLFGVSLSVILPPKLSLGLMFLIFGLVFWIIGWIKSIQQWEEVIEWYNYANSQKKPDKNMKCLFVSFKNKNSGKIDVNLTSHFSSRIIGQV